MPSPIFNKIIDDLNHGTCVFPDTNIDDAIDYFESNIYKECFRVAIVGDINIKNIKIVTTVIKELLKPFGYKEDIDIFTGTLNGVDRIVQKFCKLSNINCIIKDHDYHPYKEQFEDGVYRRNDGFIKHCHALIVFTDDSSKLFNDMYDKAVNKGLLVFRKHIE